MLQHWSQFVPNMSTDIRGHEVLLHHHHQPELRSCVNREMGPGSQSQPQLPPLPPSLINHTIYVDASQSPGEIKRREVSWTLSKNVDAFAGPGEIQRREVSWTLSKNVVAFAGPGEIKRREVSWTLTKKSDADPGDIKRREVSWTLTKKSDALADPGDIKRREVSWTLTKKSDALADPGDIKRREVSWTLTKKSDALADPGDIKRREVSWTHKFQATRREVRSRARSCGGGGGAGPTSWLKSREVGLGLRAGLLLLQLFPNGGAMDIVFVTLFRIAVGTATAWCCVARCAMPDGPALTFCCSGGGPRQPWSSGLASVSRFHSSVPLFPLVPVPNRPSRLRGR